MARKLLTARQLTVAQCQSNDPFRKYRMTQFNQHRRTTTHRANPGVHASVAGLRKAIPGAVLIAISSIGSVGSVWADDAVEALDEIVVTTRNRKEAAQSVPVPVSVVNAKELERDNATTFSDFSRKLPNVSMVQNQPRQSSAAIRGVGKNDSGEQYEGSVGVIVDGVYFVHPGSNWGNFIDLDRIEVARGPQGTLLGKNTTMGVINIATKMPSFEKGGQFEVGYGERNTVRTQGTITGPLASGLLAYRATFGYEKGNGTITNTYRDGETLNDLNRVNGRFQLLATPTESFNARLIVDFNRTADYNGAWPINVADPKTYTNGVTRASAGSPTYTVRAARFPGYSDSVVWNSFDSYAANSNAPLINESSGWSGQLNWNLPGGYNLTSITAARSYLFKPHNDYDTLNGSGSEVYYGGQVDTKQKSQELRLTSPVGGALDYQTGLYYLNVQHKLINTPGAAYGSDSGKYLASTTQYNTLNASAVGRLLLTDSLNGAQNLTLQQPGVDSLGLYGQMNWHFNDKSSLTLGLRQTRESRENSYEASSNAAALLALSAANYAGATAAQLSAAQALRDKYLKSFAYQADSLSQSSTAWLINPSYKLSNEVLLYASSSYGEKSGAVQFDSSTGKPTEHVKPERALDFELGVKSTLLDKKLRLNVNLFQTSISDYQTKIRVTNDGGVTYTTPFANADKVVTKGVELDTAYAPDHRWTFSATGAYSPARFDSWKNGVCPAEVDTSVTTGTPVCDNSGKRLSGASDFSLSVGADYRAPLSQGLVWHTFINNAYRSEYNASPTLSSYGVQSGFSLLDAGIGIGPANGSYDISLVGKNLLNKQYLISVSDFTGTNPFRAASGTPRFIGITLRAKL
jgi:iron complex outermembrane receptor protein